MIKRVFVIHGWDGSSQEERYQKLKIELENKSFDVYLLDMPDTSYPKIQPWVSYLAKQVENPDKNVYFVGNSVGCQTILRYLQDLPEKTKIGGAVFSAGWFNLKNLEDEEVKSTAKSWLETPIKFDKTLKHCKDFTAIFSDDDPFVPLSDKDIFKKKLNAKIIIEKNKGHFPGYDKGKKLIVIAEEILNMSKIN